MTFLTANVVVDPPSSARQDISLPQERRYRERIARFVNSQGEPLPNIDWWTFALDIRREQQGAVVLSCTVANGRLEVDAGLAHVVLDLSAADVQALGTGRLRYDLRVARNGYANQWYPVRGIIDIQPQITR